MLLSALFAKLPGAPFAKFVEASPVSVIMRAIIENQFHPQRLQRIFEENAVNQDTRTLPFSTVAEVMGEVVFNVNPSVNAALKERSRTLPVSVSAFYQKLNGIEPTVSAVLVRDSASQLAPLIHKLGERTPLLPGYNLRKSDTGQVYEQSAVIADPETGQWLTIRCITVAPLIVAEHLLKMATRDGDKELRMLTNLSKTAADAVQVSNLYRKRWSVETLFQEMTENLTCEIRTLGYPRAAVFAFCIALMAWNGLSAIHAALRNVHGEATVDEKLSNFYGSLEIAQVYNGMMIAIPADEWSIFQNLTVPEMASVLNQLAAKVSLEKFQKSKRGPKRPQPKRKPSGNGQHVATAKLLARRSD